jgi:hypothetical protein
MNVNETQEPQGVQTYTDPNLVEADAMKSRWPAWASDRPPAPRKVFEESDLRDLELMWLLAADRPVS